MDTLKWPNMSFLVFTIQQRRSNTSGAQALSNIPSKSENSKHLISKIHSQSDSVKQLAFSSPVQNYSIPEDLNQVIIVSRAFSLSPHFNYPQTQKESNKFLKCTLIRHAISSLIQFSYFQFFISEETSYTSLQTRRSDIPVSLKGQVVENIHFTLDFHPIKAKFHKLETMKHDRLIVFLQFFFADLDSSF